MNNINKSSTGANYLFRGFKMLSHPKVRHFVIIPLIINTIVFALLLLLSIHQFHNLVSWIDGFLPKWLQWLNWLFWLLFAGALLIVITYTFNIIANLISAPFNALLAEKVEELLTGEKSNSSLAAGIKDIPRAIKLQLRIFLYYLPRAVICLILFFIPLIQTFAPVIWFGCNSWMMGLQYLNYPMDNNRLTFKEVKERLLQQKSANLIFGATIMLAMMIPIVNFIVIPSAVAGATIFWVEKF